jgi:hypothetical protein
MTEVKDIEVHRGQVDGGELDLSVGVALPVGFRLQATDDRLTVTSKARSRTLPYLGLFSAVAVGFAGFHVWLMLVAGAELVSMVVAAAYVAAAMVPAYFTAAAALNRTDVVVNSTGVRTRARPLRLPGLADVDRELIEALAVEDDGFYTAGRVRVDGWKVVAKVRGRFAPVVLLRGLPARAQADAVAGHIARYLRLPSSR